MFRRFGFIALKTLNYLAFQSFDFERTWWRLFQKRVVCTKFNLRFYFPSRTPVFNSGFLVVLLIFLVFLVAFCVFCFVFDFIYLFVFFLYIVCTMLPVPLDFTFLIASSFFSNVYYRLCELISSKFFSFTKVFFFYFVHPSFFKRSFYYKVKSSFFSIIWREKN